MKKSCIALISFAALCMAAPAALSATTTIRYYARAVNGSEELENQKKMVAEFQKQYPNIKVKLENNPDFANYVTKLLTMTAAGIAPDVVFLPTHNYPYFASRKLLKDLTPLIKQDKSFDLSDYFDTAVDTYRYRGKIYALPNDMARLVFSYNKNLLASTGVAEPGDNWTWADFLDKCIKITKDKNGDGKPDQWGTTGVYWFPFVYENKGLLFDKASDPSKCTMNTPEVVEAIQFVDDLTRKHRVVGGDFYQGKSGFMHTGHWLVPKTVQSVKNFKWDVVALPRGKQPGNRADGSGWAIPSGSRNPEAAWKFIRFMAGEEGQELNNKLGWITPVMKKVANSKAFLNPPGGPANAKAFLADMNQSYVMALTPNWMQIEPIINRELGFVWNGKKTAIDAMNTVVKDVARYLK